MTFILNETIIISNFHLPSCLPPFNSIEYALYCGRLALYLLYEIPRKKRCGCLSSRYLAFNKYLIVATVSSLTPHAYAHAHGHTRTHTHTLTQVHTHTYTHARTHTHAYTHAHASARTHMHARTRPRTRTRTHTYTQDQLLIGLA